MSLHHAYQVFESLLERMARALGMALPSGERSHQDLLDEACADLPGLRPALVPEAARHAWQELLRFRRFFRHAYHADLNPVELSKNRDHLALAIAATEPRIHAAIDALAREG